MGDTEAIERLLAEHALTEGFVGTEGECVYRNYICTCGWWSTADQESTYRAHVAAEIASALAGAGAQVTEGAVSAAAERLYQFNEWGIDSKGDYYENQTPWDSIGDGAQDVYRRMARAALTAAAPHPGTGQSEADLRAEQAEKELAQWKDRLWVSVRERMVWSHEAGGHAGDVPFQHCPICEAAFHREQIADLRARISALADEWASPPEIDTTTFGRKYASGYENCYLDRGRDLRDLLDRPATEGDN